MLDVWRPPRTGGSVGMVTAEQIIVSVVFWLAALPLLWVLWRRERRS
jgi:hypothetical protein